MKNFNDRLLADRSCDRWRQGVLCVIQSLPHPDFGCVTRFAEWFCVRPSFPFSPSTLPHRKAWYSGYVRTHQKNSGDGVYRLGTIIQSILCTQAAWPFGNSLVSVGTQGLFRHCMKTIFCRAFSPDPTDCLWLSEDALFRDTKGVTSLIYFISKSIGRSERWRFSDWRDIT